MHRLLCAILAATLAQSVSPTFDAVSIKRSKTELPGPIWGTSPGGGLSMTNGAALNVIYSGYTLKNRDVVGLPEWARTERYDVIGTTTSRPARAELEAMVRQLLAEHFKLRAHFEPRDQPVYTLVLARSDRPLPPAMQRLSVDCAALARARDSGATVDSPLLPDGEPACGYRSGGGVLTARGMTMPTLAEYLASVAERVVIDRTSLQGDYAFTLTYTSDPRATDGVTVFTALQDLGLKLEPARAPVDTLVIDHIERPAEN